MDELREGDPCPALCGHPLVVCYCCEGSDLICLNCGEDPDDCDCTPIPDGPLRYTQTDL
jgi:hypothetical protein